MLPAAICRKYQKNDPVTEDHHTESVPGMGSLETHMSGRNKRAIPPIRNLEEEKIGTAISLNKLEQAIYVKHTFVSPPCSLQWKSHQVLFHSGCLLICNLSCTDTLQAQSLLPRNSAAVCNNALMTKQAFTHLKILFLYI